MIYEELTKESYFVFSGGEVHLQRNSNPKELVVKDYTMNGFMALAEAVEVYRRLGKTDLRVVYPYFPYARQDRVMVRNEPFSLKIFTDLVNSLKLNSIEIWDPHSDVTPALLNNCHVIPQWEIAKTIIPKSFFEDESVMFVSPDSGAYKKVSKLIANDKRIAIGVKNRDAEGNITHTSVYSPTSLEGKTCIMVDDICDGGRTFIELAKALRDNGAANVQLYVTHGIFSKGIEKLQKYIDHIYTTDSFPSKIPNSLITVGSVL